jgi:hypothetical protein
MHILLIWYLENRGVRDSEELTAGFDDDVQGLRRSTASGPTWRVRRSEGRRCCCLLRHYVKHAEGATRRESTWLREVDGVDDHEGTSRGARRPWGFASRHPWRGATARPGRELGVPGAHAQENRGEEKLLSPCLKGERWRGDPA